LPDALPGTASKVKFAAAQTFRHELGRRPGELCSCPLEALEAFALGLFDPAATLPKHDPMRAATMRQGCWRQYNFAVLSTGQAPVTCGKGSLAVPKSPMFLVERRGMSLSLRCR